MTGSNHKKGKTPNELHQQIADEILEQLEVGVDPWQKPWDAESAKASMAGAALPVNVDREEGYRGINTLMLMKKQADLGHADDPRWATFKQAQKHGGKVAKGEKASSVYYYSHLDKIRKDENGDPVYTTETDPDTGESYQTQVVDTIPILKEHKVFHASQIEDDPKAERPFSDLTSHLVPETPTESKQFDDGTTGEIREKIQGMGVEIVDDAGDVAAYAPNQDRIMMPSETAFPSADNFQAVLLHEAGHATGHESRMNRDMGQARQDYAYEELIAEMSSAMSCAEMGVVHDLGQHASYIDSWRQAIKNDPKVVVKAANEAQKATDWVMGRTVDPQAEKVRELYEASDHGNTDETLGEMPDSDKQKPQPDSQSQPNM